MRSRCHQGGRVASFLSAHGVAPSGAHNLPNNTAFSGTRLSGHNAKALRKGPAGQASVRAGTARAGALPQPCPRPTAPGPRLHPSPGSIHPPGSIHRPFSIHPPVPSPRLHPPVPSSRLHPPAPPAHRRTRGGPEAELGSRPSPAAPGAHSSSCCAAGALAAGPLSAYKTGGGAPVAAARPE